MYLEMNQAAKNLAIVRLMGILLFCFGLSSTYFEWPVNHPWWFDITGFMISVAMVMAPAELISASKSIISKKV